MKIVNGAAQVLAAPTLAARDRRGRTRDLVATLIMVAALAVYVMPSGNARAAGPVVALSPASGVVGTKVTITGSGFAPKSAIVLTWDGATAGMPAELTNGHGEFRAAFKVPKSAAGQHAAAATQAATTTSGSLQAGAQFEVTAVALKRTATPMRNAAPTATATPKAIRMPKVRAETAAPSLTPTPAPTATAFPTASPSPIPTPRSSPGPSTSGFVVRCGLGLCLDGQPYRFTGLNIYNANSRLNCWYTLGTGTALDSSLTAIGTGQEAFRAWFFQRLATTNEIRDWSAFDHTLAVAAAHGERVVVTLADQWGNCESSGSPVYKSEGWYQSGYKSRVDAEVTQPYREWVREVVTRYRDNPNILAWQMINEAEAKTSVTGSCTATAEASVHDWAVDISGLIKSLDSRHLVSLGTIGNGQCGTSTGTSYEALHALSTVDLCEYHDYGNPSAPMPGDIWNGLATRLAQCHALGKPMFVGETGILVSTDDSLLTRATQMESKFSAQFGAGVVGELLWEWAADGTDTGDGFSIHGNDPVLDLLKAY